MILRYWDTQQQPSLLSSLSPLEGAFHIKESSSGIVERMMGQYGPNTPLRLNERRRAMGVSGFRVFQGNNNTFEDTGNSCTTVLPEEFFQPGLKGLEASAHWVGKNKNRCSAVSMHEITSEAARVI